MFLQQDLGETEELLELLVLSTLSTDFLMNKIFYWPKFLLTQI